MKVISLNNTNENTNTLNINVNGTITVQELLDKATVQDFAPGIRLESIETVDGNSAELLAREPEAMLNMQLTDDSVIEISCFGEVKAQVEKKPGSVTVELGGEGVKRKMIIMNGETTVAQVLTEKLANVFGRSHSELLNMQAFVNDSKVDNSVVLYDGDGIVLQERKAGSGACDGEHEVILVDINETEDYVLADSNATLRCFLEHTAPEYFGEDVVIDKVTAINGDAVCSGLVYEMALDNLKMGQIEQLEFNAEFLEDYPDPENEEEDEEPLTADGVPAQAASVPGTVIVHLEGTSIESPTDAVKMMIINNRTTLEDVVFTDKVLNKLAFTNAQMHSMNFAINDVNVHAMDVPLKDGDVISVKIPKCGSGACC